MTIARRRRDQYLCAVADCDAVLGRLERGPPGSNAEDAAIILDRRYGRAGDGVFRWLPARPLGELTAEDVWEVRDGANHVALRPGTSDIRVACSGCGMVSELSGPIPLPNRDSRRATFRPADLASPSTGIVRRRNR